MNLSTIQEEKDHMSTSNYLALVQKAMNQLKITETILEEMIQKEVKSHISKHAHLQIELNKS